MRVIYLILILISVHVSPLVRAQEKIADWVVETPNAAWQARDSQGELVYKNKLWIFGGWFNSQEAPPRDVWSSSDGISWKLHTNSAPWIHSDLSMSITFKNKMFMMGGWYNGRLKGHSASNKVWTSRNGLDWKLETNQATWSPRIASAVVEFKVNSGYLEVLRTTILETKAALKMTFGIHPMVGTGNWLQQMQAGRQEHIIRLPF
jgi:hypothetical protein